MSDSTTEVREEVREEAREASPPEAAEEETSEQELLERRTLGEVELNELIEAGVHFGHQTRRWNPKMRPFIFAERNGIHIIDLRKTLDRLREAQAAIRRTVHKGERVLMVCTKRQLRSIIEEEAARCGALYVTERWLGGMLTNFQTIRKQIRRLKELERGQEENAFEFYTKKERLLIDRERMKLEKYLSGVKEMSRLPGAIFVVDAHREEIAVREANRLEIPVVAITDTNADPDRIDYPIPGNDDAIRAVGLITRAIADTVLLARREMPEEGQARGAEVEATTYSTETGEKVAAAGKKPARPRPKRRKKRVPRPEVIARKRRPKGRDEDGDEAEEGEEEGEGDEPTAEASRGSGEGDAAASEESLDQEGSGGEGQVPEDGSEPVTAEAEAEAVEGEEEKES